MFQLLLSKPKSVNVIQPKPNTVAEMLLILSSRNLGNLPVTETNLRSFLLNEHALNMGELGRLLVDETII